MVNPARSSRGSCNLTHVAASRRLESGNGEDDYAFTQHALYFFALLVLGVMLVIFGFGRVGAAAATERGAFVAGTAQRGAPAGAQVQAAFFRGFANADAGSLAVEFGERSVRLRLNRHLVLAVPLFGSIDAHQEAAMEKRRERFYGGPE